MSEESIEGGSYEVIRARLIEHARELAERTSRLDEARRETFGGGGLEVIANERVRTQNNCVPRDMVQVRGQLLFGYNVFLGLRKETVVGDVFSLHKFETLEGGAYDLGEIADAPFLHEPQFVKEFQDLYRYYKDTRLLQLRLTDTLLLAVFQVGATVNDVKVFRWSLPAGGVPAYVDNRGDRDHVFPAQHDFEWTQTTRDDQVHGRHPHVSVLDEVFVETVHGDLTIKIEDNTETGAGIYSEPVEDPNQSLDDSDIAYAKVGRLLLLRIRPFREPNARYFVYNARNERATRLDAIGQACRQLPEDHGIVFPGGYYLESGEHKVFDTNVAGLEFERSIRAPNGEDVLYVFHRRDEGRYVLFPYNLIRKEVQTPIDGNGYSLFADGRMILFRAAAEPSRVHPVQIWQTPFTSAEYAAKAPVGTSFLAKVGNADLVRGISEAFGVVRLVQAQEPTRRTYEDLIGAANRVLDGYYWLGSAEAHDLRATLLEVRKTAEQIVDEFEKVQAMRKRASDALSEAKAQLKELGTKHRPEDLASVEAFMGALTAVRRQRGHLVSMKEIRYVDLAAIEALEKETSAHGDRTSAACVEFLLKEGALAPIVSQIDAVSAEVEKVEKAAQLAPIAEKLDGVAEGLELVGEIVTQIKIDDVTQRARILEDIADVLGRANRARALLVARKKDLGSREGRAEFAAQFKLLGQAVASSLGLVDTPERADQELARLMLSLEELEARFGEFDEFTGDLAAKREEIYEAFGAQKQALLDARQKRASALFTAAERILTGARRRAAQFKDADELNAYFTSDAMVEKLRQLAAQLRELGDTVKADEVESQLKSARQEALRALRDTLDLFDEAGVIKLGRHKFHVNTQPIEPALVAKDGALYLHLGGTDFHERIDDPELEAAKDYWDQHLASESKDVYRAEHLAASILFDAEAGKVAFAQVRDDAMAVVRSYAESRYDEGYERGVHDHDAAKILEKLVPVWEGAGSLRFAPIARALATVLWSELADDARAPLLRRAKSAGRLRSSLARGDAMADVAEHLAKLIDALPIEHAPGDAREAGRYLAEELASSDRFTTSGDAARLTQALLSHVDRAALEEDLRGPFDVSTRWRLASAWVHAFLAKTGGAAHAAPEAIAILLTPSLARSVSEAPTSIEITELVGSHARIAERTLRFSIDEYVARLRDHLERRVPAYRAYRKRRQEIVERERARMRLDELRPKPMSSFVRNRLIDEVYLPVIGDNLAKQIGAAGAAKRTDLMGMLLLVSPPGYGKTTLMEYIASRLGLVFVKVNGPALGHAVHSLDPGEAPNATARQEVERINFAFELGNNVMLYLDDIQHTDAELLQKFISLCDAQRKIEGVWKGKTRTYDLRGKKFCVVMAGNPYTESGEKFRIPDMLANRADTYNLGEILQGRDDAFASSYVENALTSNAALAPLAAREYGDVLKLLRIAAGEDVATTELSYGYAPAEIAEITAVMQRLFKVRDVLLRVNAQYIASASQQDSFRTEPPFKLQGSYRNMTKLAEKVVAAMNDEELERLIDDHYLGESQTLTTGAEENLLKLAELRARMTDAQRSRWEEIKKDYRRIQTMGGKDDDPVTRVTGTLSSMGLQLDAIKNAVTDAAAKMYAKPNGELEATLAELASALHSVARPQLEVTVQNEPPPAATELFAQQVKVVESAVLPLVRTLGEQLDDNRAVYMQILDILERLKSIEKRLG